MPLALKFSPSEFSLSEMRARTTPENYAIAAGTFCSDAGIAGNALGISPNSQALICNAITFE
jgi:hypothetical protein